MRDARLLVLGVCLALSLVACRKERTQALPDGGVAVVPESEESGANEPGAAATPPAEAEFTLRYTLLDGGVEAIPGGTSETPLIEPTQRLELETNVPLRNYRVRLFDEADRAMISDDLVADSDAGVRYFVTLPEPLKTGHGYTLVVDAQSGASIVDTQGRDVKEQRIGFKVAGEKQKPAPAAKPARRRRH